MSLYFFNTLFIRTNSSRIICESIKALETKTSLLFNLVFAKNTILSCFFLFFLIIELQFLIPAVTAQTFYPITELAVPIGIPTNEAKAETETHRVIKGTKISDHSM